MADLAMVLRAVIGHHPATLPITADN
jgi:hypothetical protein